jgi:enolase
MTTTIIFFIPGVQKAVDNVNSVIGPALISKVGNNFVTILSETASSK